MIWGHAGEATWPSHGAYPSGLVDPAPEAEPTLVDGRGAFSTVRARSDSTPRPLRKEDGDV